MMDEGSLAREKELKAQNQAQLAQFLNTDLDLAFTMLQTAQIEAKYDPPQVPAVLAKVRHVLETVRQFTGRIQDRPVWSKLHSRTDELEARLAEFCARPPTPEP